MNANELRIGSLVFSKETKEVEIITGVSDIHISFSSITSGYPTIEEIEPILLTEKWLLKFGFKKTTDGFLKIKTRKRGVCLEINLKTKRFILFNSFFTELLFLEHVHQLQNLYFALTGQELTIK